MSGSSIIIDHIYGKDGVKVLYVKRDGDFHSIRELEVSTKLKLNNIKDYITGDNSDIIATDTQKNTVYVLAKNYGIKTPEQFALLMSDHFLKSYPHVVRAIVNVTERSWARITSETGKQHNHSFVSVPDAIRSATVSRSRNEAVPTIQSSLEDIRVLKTTKSAFVNFHRDDYRSLPDAEDRIFSTIIKTKWTYNNRNANIDFDRTADVIKAILLGNFAGEFPNGTMSPSVQNTLYLCGKEALEKLPHLDGIQIEMPNVHYLTADLSKFPRLVKGTNNEVFVPTDKPAGYIFVDMGRQDLVSKL